VVRITSNQTGITREELLQAVPESLLAKGIHLYWVEKSPNGMGRFVWTAKVEIGGEVLLLRSHSEEKVLAEAWNVDDPTYHTNARLLALERILTDPANEDMLLSL